jgi:hypothetical protein
MRKKDLEREITLLNKRVLNLEERSYKVLEILKASGLIELLEEGEDMVTVPYNSPFGFTKNNHYKINEVF